jgi:hypothetical protein
VRGSVKPIVERVYPLGEASEALRWVHDAQEVDERNPV